MTSTAANMDEKYKGFQNSTSSHKYYIAGLKKSSKTSVCEEDAGVITTITDRKAHLLEQISWTLNVAGGSFDRTATYTLVVLCNQPSVNVALATELTSVKTNSQRFFSLLPRKRFTPALLS